MDLKKPQDLGILYKGITQLCVISGFDVTKDEMKQGKIKQGCFNRVRGKLFSMKTLRITKVKSTS